MKKTLSRIFVAISILLFTTSCVSYKYSNKRDSEQVIMVVNEDPNGILSNVEITPQLPPGQSARGVATEAISLAKEGVKLLIEMDKQKYTAAYAASKRQLYFYNNISDEDAVDPTGMQFEGIEIIRLAESQKGKIDTALYIRLIVDTDKPQEMINNSTFRLKVDELKINYAKAKIPGFRWYMPWSGIYINKTHVNLDLELILTSSWIYRNGTVVHDNVVGTFMLNLRNVPLDPESDEYKTFYKGIKNKVIDGESFLVPRSFGRFVTPDGNYKQCFGQGVYNISASITEAGKQHFVTKIVQENSGMVIEEINTMLLNFVE